MLISVLRCSVVFWCISTCSRKEEKRQHHFLHEENRVVKAECIYNWDVAVDRSIEKVTNVDLCAALFFLVHWWKREGNA